MDTRTRQLRIGNYPWAMWNLGRLTLLEGWTKEGGRLGLALLVPDLHLPLILNFTAHLAPDDQVRLKALQPAKCSYGKQSCVQPPTRYTSLQIGSVHLWPPEPYEGNAESHQKRDYCITA